MSIDFQRVWNYYSRESILKAIVEAAKNREVACIFRDGRFGKRPDVIQYPQDIVHAVAEGAVSFHGSVEKWHQPMQLDVGMSKQSLDQLRSGWDILVDPDVDDFQIAKVVTKQIIDVFKDHGITSVSVKYTGGDSFHIGVPFESLPEKINLNPTSSQYPEILQKIVEYLKWYMKDELREEILATASPAEIAEKIKKPVEYVISEEKFDPFKVVALDVFSSRHLFRLPYSLYEKSLLVSLPIRPESIDRFEKEHALPEKVKVEEKFLIPKTNANEAEALIIEALDWASKNLKELEEEIQKPVVVRKMKYIPEEYFPPCIQHILQGVADGRKRSVFILVNFLRNMGWSLDKVEERLLLWNEKNYPPLRTNYIRTQLRWHFRQERNLLPPNCDNENFYKQMGLYDICQKAHQHMGIKNPVNYPFRKMGREMKRRRK
ncbi:MAG: hypothetical protein V1944_00550 [Candidatus Aenigmatarchaeota archaeon]